MARSRGDSSYISSKIIPLFGEKIPLPIFGSKLGSNTHFLVKFFTLNHVLFRKIVNLILNYVKSYLFTCQILKNIFTILFRNFSENLIAVPLSISSAKTYFFPLLLSKIAEFSAIWQQYNDAHIAPSAVANAPLPPSLPSQLSYS